MNFKRFSKLLFSLISGVIFSINIVQAQGIKFFEGNWEQLMAEAKKEHKAVFVDCYTSWCGPCKMMATKIFPQKIVGDYYNEHFICYSMDMEKGEGPSLSRFFKIKFYPTLLYLSEDGALMHRTAGAVPTDMFLEQGRMALDPRNCLAGRIARFKQGERDTTFLIELAILIRNIDDQIQEDALTAYWNQVSDPEKSTPINWLRFKQLDNSVNSPEFQYVETHKAEFFKNFGEDEVTKTLFEKAAYSIQHAAETKNEALMLKAKAVLDSSHMDDIMRFAALGELMYYKSTADFKKFHTLAKKFVENFAKNNADDLNNVAFEALTADDNIDLLKDAAKWEEQSMKIHKYYANTDTYAHILYKLGKKKEAEQFANEALDYAKKEGINDARTRELLKLIQGN